MRFYTSAVLALAAPLLAWAQTNSSNPFTLQSGFSATAGETATLTWQPTTSGTVSILLRSGASSALNDGTTIAANIENSGSYTWSVPSDVTRGSDYAFEIKDDTNPDNTNYSAYFVIESTNTVASVTGTDTTGMASSTASSSGSATSGMTTATESSTGSATSGSTTGSSSGSMTSSASRTSASASDAVLTSTSAASGSRATAMTGFLGMAALGAMAL